MIKAELLHAYGETLTELTGGIYNKKYYEAKIDWEMDIALGGLLYEEISSELGFDLDDVINGETRDE